MESLPQLLGSSRAVSDKVEKIPSPCEVDLNKAMMIAKGRKAKQLKRKTHSGAHSAILKIRKTDLNNIKVTDEELKAVVDELSSSSSNHPGFVRIDLPIFDRSLEAYKDVLNFPLPNTTNFRIRCDVFRDLWLRGYYMTDGLKFGCDFLVYENRPGTVHSRWILKCIEYLSNIHPRDIITLSRVSSQFHFFVVVRFTCDRDILKLGGTNGTACTFPWLLVLYLLSGLDDFHIIRSW
ncbi:hypothetical protein AB6A40_000399 [Gnathostoma spinigerum]|uniref:tRNA-intron lyase n=1 Tax=Gnathostoma spinigerum TaxID=75299 RepID=A0ABD6E2Z2_9BILA